MVSVVMCPSCKVEAQMRGGKCIGCGHARVLAPSHTDSGAAVAAWQALPERKRQVFLTHARRPVAGGAAYDGCEVAIALLTALAPAPEVAVVPPSRWTCTCLRDMNFDSVIEWDDECPLHGDVP